MNRELTTTNYELPATDSPLRLGLIGDTHYPEAGPLWDEAYDALRGVDLILHAGDLHVVETERHGGRRHEERDQRETAGG